MISAARRSGGRFVPCTSDFSSLCSWRYPCSGPRCSGPPRARPRPPAVIAIGRWVRRVLWSYGAGSRRPRRTGPVTAEWIWPRRPAPRCGPWPPAGSCSRGGSPAAGCSPSDSPVRVTRRCVRRTNRSARCFPWARGSAPARWWPRSSRGRSTVTGAVCTGACCVARSIWIRCPCCRPGCCTAPRPGCSRSSASRNQERDRSWKRKRLFLWHVRHPLSLGPRGCFTRRCSWSRPP